MYSGGNSQMVNYPPWDMAAYHYAQALQAGYAVPPQPPSKKLVADLVKIIEHQGKELLLLKTPQQQPCLENLHEKDSKLPCSPSSSVTECDGDEGFRAPHRGPEMHAFKATVLSRPYKRPVEESIGNPNEPDLEPNYNMSRLEALTAVAVDQSSQMGTVPRGYESNDYRAFKRPKAAKRQKASGHASDEFGRMCTSCGTTTTPKWRCGMTLCNACGLRNAKKAQQNSRPMMINRVGIPGLSPRMYAGGAMMHPDGSVYQPGIRAPMPRHFHHSAIGQPIGLPLGPRHHSGMMSMPHSMPPPRHIIPGLGSFCIPASSGTAVPAVKAIDTVQAVPAPSSSGGVSGPLGFVHPGRAVSTSSHGAFNGTAQSRMPVVACSEV